MSVEGRVWRCPGYKFRCYSSFATPSRSATTARPHSLRGVRARAGRGRGGGKKKVAPKNVPRATQDASFDRHWVWQGAKRVGGREVRTRPTKRFGWRKCAGTRPSTFHYPGKENWAIWPNVGRRGMYTPPHTCKKTWQLVTCVAQNEGRVPKTNVKYYRSLSESVGLRLLLDICPVPGPSLSQGVGGPTYDDHI